MADDPLFNATDLTNWLGVPVTELRATSAERVVWGWLRPVLELDARPASPSAELYSWAVELGGIAHENPAGLAAYQLADERTQFSSERRMEILEEAAAGGAVQGSAAAGPQGSFPDPLPWPDPIRC